MSIPNLYQSIKSQRSSSWQLKTQTLTFGMRPLIMGIVNVTPDSFSDGGKFTDPQIAIDHALQLASSGADILDIGGESTRPYSNPVTVQEESDRVIPVIAGLAARTSVPISIDTTKAFIAQQAIEAGAEIINDVTGLEGDPEMISIAKSSGAGLCVMHMQGTPQTMQDNPSYQDVVAEIHEYLKQRKDWLESQGIPREKICLDPGIGFGKTHQHNLELMANSFQFHDLGCPLLVGHSRKGFIAKLLQEKECDRVYGTIGGTLALAAQGIQVIRVHDVLATHQALEVFSASGGIDGQSGSAE